MAEQALTRIELEGIPRIQSGKVRELFDLGDRLLLVATDRISAFDVVLGEGIPHKGEILTGLSEFWFRETETICPNHFQQYSTARWPRTLENYEKQLRNRAMIVRKTKPLPIECVVRGYLAGSGWKDYRRTGKVCGLKLPAGLQLSAELPRPLFTPATKAATGHDENISFEQACRLIGEDLANRVKQLSLRLYDHARDLARKRQIIIADTKFEFGLIDGELLLIDEALTPDSSRFWPAADWSPGRPQESFDKQFIRDYLESSDWNKVPPAPRLPREIIEQTCSRYQEAYRIFTGKPFSPG